MVKLNERFDASQVETGFTIPEGDYKAVIKSSEMKESKAGNPLIVFNFEVIDGDFKGRTLRLMCNYQHPNDIARRIADQQLAGMGEAVGKEQFTDTSELHNLPMLITVKHSEYNGEKQNEIRKFKSLADGAAPETSAGGTKPWEKK